MHIIEIPEKNIRKYLPVDLSECDPLQYIEMSALIFDFQYGTFDYQDFRVHALYKLLDMKAVKKPTEKVNYFSGKRETEIDYEKFSKIYQLSELIDSFFEENEAKEKVIKQYYIHNPIPKFRGALRNFYGPANDFENVKFGEYVDALEEFINFNQTGEMIYLNRLLAIMYRKKKLFFGERQKYHPENVDKTSKFFNNQHIGIIYGFYLYFASFQKYIVTAKMFVQGNEIDLSILFDSTDSDESNLPGLGMKGVLLSMAESGVYGSEKGVRDTPLWEVLIRMYDITKRNADEKADVKKNSK